MTPRPGEQPFKGLWQSIWVLFGRFYIYTEVSMKQDDFKHMIGRGR
jgi:hypothetical protein